MTEIRTVHLSSMNYRVSIIEVLGCTMLTSEHKLFAGVSGMSPVNGLYVKMLKSLHISSEVCCRDHFSVLQRSKCFIFNLLGNILVDVAKCRPLRTRQGLSCCSIIDTRILLIYCS
jgi:hypothetical protein